VQGDKIAAQAAEIRHLKKMMGELQTAMGKLPSKDEAAPLR
jgi:hypothetical protein